MAEPFELTRPPSEVLAVEEVAASAAEDVAAAATVVVVEAMEVEVMAAVAVAAMVCADDYRKQQDLT